MNRPFQSQSRRNHAEAARCIEFFVVPVLHFDVQNRGAAPAKFGGHRAFVKCHVFQCIGIENGEKTEQMRGIVNRRFVEENQILVNCTAPDIKTGVSVACRFHAGYKLQGLDDVLFAKNNGDVFNVFWVEFGDGHLVV